VPAKVPLCEYAEGFAARVQLASPQRSPVFVTDAPDDGNVPPSMRMDWAATWVTPAPVTSGSIGMVNAEAGAEHAMPAQASAVVSVRATEVR